MMSSFLIICLPNLSETESRVYGQIKRLLVMIEIILLAGAVSVELEPYAVENRELDGHGQETNANENGRPYQWTTRRSDPSSHPNEDTIERDRFGNAVKRDAFGRPVEIEK